MRGIVCWLAVYAAVGLTACGGSGGSGGSKVEVLQGDAALQASSEAVVSVSVALQVLLADASDTFVARAASTTGGAMTGARAVRVVCPAGGSLDGECREEGGRTIVTTDSDECALFDEARGGIVVSTGRAVATYQATGVCGATVPVGVATTSELRDYREEWRDGATVLRVTESSRLDIEFRPGSGGCSSNQGTSSLDGDLRVRGDGLDMGLRMKGLELEVTSAGNPCDQTVRVEGSIEVEDTIRGARFAGTTAGLTYTTRRVLDGVFETALEGNIDIDCLGTVSMATIERLALGPRCPLGGEMELSIDGATSATSSFTLDGLFLDYQSDGSIDFESATCGRDSLSVCM